MIVAGLAFALATWLLLARGRPRAKKEVPDRGRAVSLDPAIACELVGAVLRSGASVPAALEALGLVVGGRSGHELAVAARMLRFGSAWPEAFAQVSPEWSPVTDALQLAWTDGVAPDSMLAATAGALRASRAARAREEAERLGVRLVLPLGLCLLPAFVLIGLVPVMIATGGDLLGWQQ